MYNRNYLIALISTYPKASCDDIDFLCHWDVSEKGSKWWCDNYYRAYGNEVMKEEFWDEIYRISCELGVDFPQYKRYNIEFIEDKEYNELFI